MEIMLIKCPRCEDSAETFFTLTEMLNHHLAHHERLLPQEALEEKGGD